MSFLFLFLPLFLLLFLLLLFLFGASRLLLLGALLFLECSLLFPLGGAFRFRLRLGRGSLLFLSGALLLLLGGTLLLLGGALLFLPSGTLLFLGGALLLLLGCALLLLGGSLLRLCLARCLVRVPVGRLGIVLMPTSGEKG